MSGLAPISTRQSADRPVAVASRSHLTPETEQMLEAVDAGELRAAGGRVTTVDGRNLTYGKADVAGMRPFENPFFVASGDETLIDRATGQAPT